MLMRTDPFRDLDRIAGQLLGTTAAGTWSRPNPMPLDAWREHDEFVVCFDLPGVSLDAIDIDVERNVLTVKAERRPGAVGEAKVEISERPLGAFSRQLFLGDTLDAENVSAGYDAGVLTLRIPVAAKAKPRKIEISAGSKKQINA
jgi:HSP20 family protein